MYYQYQFILKKNRELRNQRTIEQFIVKINTFNNAKDNRRNSKLNRDLHRKAFHLLPAVLIIFLYLFAVYIWDRMWNADQFWGISGEEYAIFLILTVGYTAIIIFSASEITFFPSVSTST